MILFNLDNGATIYKKKILSTLSTIHKLSRIPYPAAAAAAAQGIGIQQQGIHGVYKTIGIGGGSNSVRTKTFSELSHLILILGMI